VIRRHLLLTANWRMTSGEVNTGARRARIDTRIGGGARACYAAGMSPQGRKTALKRISLASIPLTAIVALVGFWRLAPGVTFIIAAIALVALIVAMWSAGGKEH